MAEMKKAINSETNTDMINAESQESTKSITKKSSIISYDKKRLFYVAIAISLLSAFFEIVISIPFISGILNFIDSAILFYLVSNINFNRMFLLDYDDAIRLAKNSGTGSGIALKSIPDIGHLQIETIDIDRNYFLATWIEMADLKGALFCRFIAKGENPLIMNFNDRISPINIQEMRRVSREFVFGHQRLNSAFQQVARHFGMSVEDMNNVLLKNSSNKK